MSADDIRANAEAIERRIVAACDRASRRREEVTLIAVSKTFPAEAVDAAFDAGLRDIGENKVQEARDKMPLVRSKPRWHLIGHLQSNKSKDAVRLFDVIHSVDSMALAEKLARAAESAGKRQEVLLQVNIGRELQKSGIDPGEVESVGRQVSALASLDVRGLMAIPPDVPAEEARRYFRELKTMRDALGLPHLSMGMSEDFEVAIEEGSTMIRIGRAIFGTRG